MWEAHWKIIATIVTMLFVGIAEIVRRPMFHIEENEKKKTVGGKFSLFLCDRIWCEMADGEE